MKKINIILIITMILGSIYQVIQKDNVDTYYMLIVLGIIPVVFLPKILNKLFKFKINIQLQLIYLLFIFFTHFLGSIYEFYPKIDNYDRLMHFVSGLLIPFLGIITLIKLKGYQKTNLIFNIVFIILFNLGAASIWEIYEFTLDKLFDKDAQSVLTTGVDDTMYDMILALLGSLIFSMTYYYEEIFKKNFIIKKFIKELNVNG